jgi:hypothetical protein
LIKFCYFFDWRDVFYYKTGKFTRSLAQAAMLSKTAFLENATGKRPHYWTFSWNETCKVKKNLTGLSTQETSHDFSPQMTILALLLEPCPPFMGLCGVQISPTFAVGFLNSSVACAEN